MLPGTQFHLAMNSTFGKGSNDETPCLEGSQTLTDSTHQVDPWAPRPLRYRTYAKLLLVPTINRELIEPILCGYLHDCAKIM